MSTKTNRGFDPIGEGLNPEAWPQHPDQPEESQTIHVTGWQHQRNGSIIFACVPEGCSLGNGERVRIGSAQETFTLNGISAAGQESGTIKGRAIVKIPVPREVPLQRNGSPITKVK